MGARKHTAPRTRDRDRDEDTDDGEAFMNFCASCETQITGTGMFCSDRCRQRDQPHPSPQTPSFSRFAPSSPAPTGDRDIIPRASPTISRPRSYFGDPFMPSSSSHTTYGSPPSHTSSSPYSRTAPGPPSALASLRSLSSALDIRAPPRRANSSSSSDDEPPPAPARAAYSYTPHAGSFTRAAYAGSMGMDRPLPPRSGAWGHRPRSIDLVTPWGEGGGS